MFRRLFQRGKPAVGRDGANFEPHMPEVDQAPNLSAVFDQARSAAAGKPPAPPGPLRHVVIVTPGRLLMFQPCPAPGSMPDAQVAAMEKMIPSARKRNIAAIAYSELPALQGNVAKAIPFLGMLLGCAYIGHAVWVFEGHASALPFGCRDADVLIADGAMVPHLAADWATVAVGVMRTHEIYVHDRKTFGLQRVRVS